VLETVPEKIDLLLNAKWILPLGASDEVLEHFAIAVSDKRILALLPQAEAAKRYRPVQTIQLNEHVLMPGLVNSHGHAPMSLFRGIADDMPLKVWLENYIWPLETKFVDETFVLHGAELAITEMLLSGTTTFADMYYFPEAVAKAAIAAHMRVQLASPVLDFPTVWATNAEEYIAKATDLHDKFRLSELVSTAFGPHAPYTVSDEPLTKIATLAEELDIPIHMHVHETAQEVADAVMANGKRPLQRLAELGLLSPRLLCVHATHLLEEEIQLLAENGSHVLHCPESNLKLASGFCATARLLAAGANVALGTDGSASNNDLDMFSEMRTAALLAKAVAEDARVVPALQALRMATINGARALGLESSVGSLEIGKYADIVAVNLRNVNAWPLYNLASHLVYSARSSQVSHVWVGGRIVVKDGELQTIDSRTVEKFARDWQHNIQDSRSSYD
jgi:5-methylthioadenosine/S-adenosylhomocysteine deaminase